MKIALLQHNFIIGDIAGNAEKILRGYRNACNKHVDLVVSTELALFGYPPRDLLEREDLIAQQLEALNRMAGAVGRVPLVVGFAERNEEKVGKPLFNSAAVLQNGLLQETRRKALLPTYY